MTEAYSVDPGKVAQAEAILEPLVDQLIAENQAVVEQFNQILATEEGASQWIDYTLTQKSDELSAIIGAAAQPFSPDEQQAIAALEAAIGKLYEENPELAVLPVETVQAWVMAGLGG